VDGDEIRLAHQLLDAHELDTHELGPIHRYERVVGHQTHAERQRPLSHQGTDPAQPDDTEGFAIELDAFPLGSLPLPCHQGGVGLRNVPSLRQQQRHGLFGRGQDVGLWGVDHHDPAFGGRRNVDVVEADAGPSHHHQIGAGRQHLGGHRGGRPNHQRLSPHDGTQQLVGGQSQLDIDVIPRLGHQVEPGLSQFFGDEHPTHGDPSSVRSDRSRWSCDSRASRRR
jgi:hypothetical protein